MKPITKYWKYRITPEAVAFIRERLGGMPGQLLYHTDGASGDLLWIIPDIATRLKQGREDVAAMEETIRLMRETRAGYTPAHLRTLLGVPSSKIRRWVDVGLLGAARSFSTEMRISKANLLRFIENSQAEYNLAKVHQGWFKTLLLEGRGARGTS
jgi:hypothetical protein